MRDEHPSLAERRAQRRRVRATKRRMRSLRAEEGGRGRRWARRARVVGTVLLVVLVLAVGTWLVDPEIDGTSARDRLRGLVEDEPEGTYAFLLIAREGGAVGWDPCEPIRYVVNPEGAPADWESFTEAAVAATAEASGFDFTYAGTTEARPLDEASVIRGAPLLISWADPEEVPELAEESVGVALTRPLVKEDRSYFVSGVVVLDEQTYAGWRATATTRRPADPDPRAGSHPRARRRRRPRAS